MRRPLALWSAFFIVSASSCDKRKSGDDPSVAMVDDRPIPASTLERRLTSISGQSGDPGQRRKQAEAQLDHLIRLEILANEAIRRGYDEDPDLRRIFREQLVNKLTRVEWEKVTPAQVPDAEIERYYREHPTEFNRPDEVRVSAILAATQQEAAKVGKELTGLAPSDALGLRKLAARYSRSTGKGSTPVGDLGFFNTETEKYPQEMVQAAFRLERIGEVSPPVKTDAGFYVLRLAQRRPGFSRPLSQVKHQIQARLTTELRSKRLDDLIAKLREQSEVKIDEAVLESLSKGATGSPADTTASR